MATITEWLEILNNYSSELTNKLNKVYKTKKNIAEAIEDRDVNVPDNASFFSYGDLIRQITGKATNGKRPGKGTGTPTQRTGYSSSKSGSGKKGLISKYIKANGTYNAADENVTGYHTVTVKVDAPQDQDQDTYTVTFVNYYTGLQEALDFMLADIDANGTSSSFFSNRYAPYINANEGKIYSQSSYTPQTLIPKQHMVTVKTIENVKKGSDIAAADIPAVPSTSSIDYITSNADPASNNRIWNGGSSGSAYKSNAEIACGGWKKLGNNYNCSNGIKNVTSNLTIYAYYGTTALTNTDNSISEGDSSSDEISDSWETIVQNKGANYSVGSYKTLIPDKKVIGIDVLTPNGKTTVEYNVPNLKLIKIHGSSEEGTSTWMLSGTISPPITWSGMCAWKRKGNVGESYAANGTNTDIPFNYRTWAKSYIREFLNTALINTFPSYLRDAILPVKKYTYVKNLLMDVPFDDGFLASVTKNINGNSLTYKTNRSFLSDIGFSIQVPNYLTVDKLWLPSAIELGFTFDKPETPVLYGSGEQNNGNYASTYGKQTTKGIAYSGIYRGNNNPKLNVRIATREAFLFHYNSTNKSSSEFDSIYNYGGSSGPDYNIADVNSVDGIYIDHFGVATGSDTRGCSFTFCFCL